MITLNYTLIPTHTACAEHVLYIVIRISITVFNTGDIYHSPPITSPILVTIRILSVRHVQ